jgi:hypothetical protein
VFVTFENNFTWVEQDVLWMQNFMKCNCEKTWDFTKFGLIYDYVKSMVRKWCDIIVTNIKWKNESIFMSSKT